jgi:hypothetical protein
MSKSVSLNISMDLLLDFLYTKKVRNLYEHGDIKDFLEDAKVTGKWEFKYLLEKQQIRDVMNENEFQALEKIYLKYYSLELNNIQIYR